MLRTFLQNIIQKITSTLGFTSAQENDAEIDPTPDTQIDFLSQVLKPTAQSIATDFFTFSNRMQDFPLSNRADNLEIAIRGYEIALTVFTRESFPIDWARTQNNLGIAYLYRIRGERAENLEIAIQCYTNALQERTRAGFPIQWAMTQNNLGLAYLYRIRGERAENLEIAIQCYTNALQERTRAGFPIQWATTQNNLGLAYLYRIREERAENLEIAIQCYTNALQERTRAGFPIQWATTQNNLGNAYWERIRGERAENLEIAIQYYTNALQERTRARFPIDWAMTQNNLGLAYSDRIRGERAENLEIAISCYTNALQEYTRARFPIDWAMTQNNLGIAYLYRIRGERADNLEIAISCYTQALQERTRAGFPIDWASTQNNLGNAYSDRIWGERAENLEIAISCYTQALQERTRARFPIDWAMTQNNLGTAYWNRIRGERAENLEIAISCYTQALQVRTRARFPIDWAMTQNNLGAAYSDRIRGERAENLEIAISCYTQALQEYTRAGFPIQWATTQNNLGIAYWQRIRGERAENLEIAISCYTNALQERTRARFPIDWATTQNNLGLAYSDRIRGERAENLEIAISCYTQALQEYTRARFPIDWAMTQNNLGAAYRNRIRGERAENLEIAISCYTQALQVRTRDALPQNHAETAFNLGLTYIDAKQYADAYNILKSAIDTVEFLRGEIVSGDEVKRKLAEEWNELYRRMVEVCLELEYYDQAVEYIERSKTRNLVELLASQSRQIPLENQGKVPPFVSGVRGNQLQEINQKIAEEKRRLEAAENPDTTYLNQLRQQREELIGQVIPLEHIRFAEIQGLVDDCTAIVQWYIFDNCFRAFIITRDNQHPRIWQSSPQDVKDLKKWSDEYLETYATDKLRWRYQLAAKLRELAEILHINDILDLIPSSCQALILVPHRYLHLLPLHALPIGARNLTPQPPSLKGKGENSKLLSLQERGLERGSTDPVKSNIGEEGNCLLDKFPGGVRYAPSCQLLKFAKSRNPTPNPSPQARRGTRTGAEESRSLFAIQDPNENLLYTNIEVQTIERNFQPTTVIEKGDATKQALFQAPAFESLCQAQVLHFSCHGYFDIDSPVDSAIALADCISPIPADADSSKRYRKLANGDVIDLEKCLTLPDIFNLNLPECRLVTLSACETGLSDPFSTSDEYIGLPSGFLKAGSSSIVSSLWSVDDLATTLLMIRFYDNQHSLPIAQALCEAQCWLRNSTQAKLIEWTQSHPNIDEEHKQTIQQDLQRWYVPEYKPFGEPEAWAGFCAIGQ